jgi:hypothetical protein
MADPVSLFRPRALRHSVAILALLLAVRALVPMGFMASATEAGIQLVFCDAGAMAVHAAGHHAHHHHAGGTTDPGCPYAQSSGPAPLPSLPMLASDVRIVCITSPVESSAVLALQGPLREQSPRGPPFLS